MEIKEHTKYYNTKGVQLPSVTSIVKLLDKPQLVGWANYLGFKRIKVEELLHEKSTYGTMVHDLFEQYMMTITGDNEDDPHYTLLRKKFKYINDTLINNGFKVVNMELQLHGDRVGGTLDLLLQHENGKFMILDLKTSKNVYDSMFIQLAGYSLLMKEVYNIDIDYVGIILISKEINDKKFFSIKTRDNNIKNEEIFNKLLDIYYLLED